MSTWPLTHELSMWVGFSAVQKVPSGYLQVQTTTRQKSYVEAEAHGTHYTAQTISIKQYSR
jgi:hypothetical protein